MRIAIIALCIVAHVAYTHQDGIATPEVKIIRSEYVREPNGNYHWAVETDDGMISEAKGELTTGPDGNLTLIMQGSNSYVAPDGKIMSMTYTADADGYHPVGDMLPTPPPTMPIPDYIQRALDYIAEKTKKGENTV